MDQTSYNAEQIGIVEDLSQMLKIIFYPLPLYYHLFKQKPSFEILVGKKAECMLFIPSCCGTVLYFCLCSFPTLEQPKRYLANVLYSIAVSFSPKGLQKLF